MASVYKKRQALVDPLSGCPSAVAERGVHRHYQDGGQGPRHRYRATPWASATRA